MSQYQVRTGPIQNNAATFSPEMVAGNTPPRNRSSHAGIGPRIPLPLSQTTHVSAAIDMPMVQGVTHPRPRLTAGKQLGQTVPTFGVDFAFESVLASRLDSRYRLTKPQHLPAFSQTTHAPGAVTASMTNAIISGAQKPRQGQPISVFSQDFAFDSVLASRLDNRYRMAKPQHLTTITQTTHVSAAFSLEMAAGIQGQTYPSRRILLGRKITSPIAETTPVDVVVAEDVTVSMTQAIITIAAFKRHTQPGFVFVQDFAFDSVLASRLDQRYRLTKPQHVAPIAQPTHVSAPFQQSMVDGVTVPRPRILRPLQLSQPTWVEVLAFSFDSVLASRLDSRNHLTYPQHLAPFSQPTHVSAPFSFEAFSRVLDLRTRQTKPRQNSQPDFVFVGAFPFESVLGSRLDSRSHLDRARQVGLPVLPSMLDFAFESILGSRLDYRNHLGRALQIGQPVPPQQAGFQFESVIASRLDYRNHLRNPIHIPPIAQPTHVQAPITVDMFKGWNSIPPQLKNTGIFLFYYTTGENLGVFVAQVGPINNPGAIGIGDLGAKGIGERGASGIGDLGAEPGSSGRGAIGRSGIRKIKKTP